MLVMMVIAAVAAALLLLLCCLAAAAHTLPVNLQTEIPMTSSEPARPKCIVTLK